MLERCRHRGRQARIILILEIKSWYRVSTQPSAGKYIIFCTNTTRPDPHLENVLWRYSHWRNRTHSDLAQNISLTESYSIMCGTILPLFLTAIVKYPSLILFNPITTMLWSILALMLCVWGVNRSLRQRLPGPILGIFSSIRHLKYAWSGNLHLDVLRLHRVHGNQLFWRSTRSRSRLTNSRSGHTVRTV